MGCAHCGVLQSEHGRRWDPKVAVHSYQAPNQRQILARMKLRRAFKQKGMS